jgi:N-acetylmuramic acid 6-phosphate etherase
MDTERLSPRYSGIDTWDPSDVLDAMIDGQFSAVAAVRAARGAIERAALAIEAQLAGLSMPAQAPQAASRSRTAPS